MKTEVITRKDGIVYERKKKEQNFDFRVNLKCYSGTIKSLKEIAVLEDKKYQQLIREILEKYIEEYEKWKKRF